jgi:hypothetical protein
MSARAGWLAGWLRVRTPTHLACRPPRAHTTRPLPDPRRPHLTTHPQATFVNGVETQTAVDVYQWTLAPTPTGRRPLVPWQPLSAALARTLPGVEWTAA